MINWGINLRRRQIRKEGRSGEGAKDVVSARDWLWPGTQHCSGAQIVPQSPLLGARLLTFQPFISWPLAVSSLVQELEWWAEPPWRHSCQFPREGGCEHGAGGSHSSRLHGPSRGDLDLTPSLSSRQVFWSSQPLPFTLETCIPQFWEIFFYYFIDNFIFYIWITSVIQVLEFLGLFSDILSVRSYFPSLFRFVLSFSCFFFKFLLSYLVVSQTSSLLGIFFVLIDSYFSFMIAISSFPKDVNNKGLIFF